MTPIICVGETLDEREAGDTEAKVLGQVRAGLDGRTAEQVAALVIAYEPIWAIGTGRTATADDAQAVCAAIRAHGACADRRRRRRRPVRIQYGGSVKAANIAELMAQPDIDGALVGGASLDPDEFARIVAVPLSDRSRRRKPIREHTFRRTIESGTWYCSQAPVDRGGRRGDTEIATEIDDARQP